MKNYAMLALDIGASNGRCILGYYNPQGKLINMQEIHRFANGFIHINNGLYWDYMLIYRELLNALRKCKGLGIKLDSIGIDAWSEDYVLIGADGGVLGLPRYYRDPDTMAHADDFDDCVDPWEFFLHAGRSKNTISTLRQLYYDRSFRSETLDSARLILFIPYLLVYLLTGKPAYDVTLPAIGEMGDMSTYGMSMSSAKLLGIADKIPPCFSRGSIIGYTNSSVMEETGYNAIPVACTDAHDTSSAVSAIPDENDFLYISSGTWSMCGATMKEPLLSKAVFNSNFCNSPQGDGRISLMGGSSGMFIIQQCMKYWKNEGLNITYEELTAYALTHNTEAVFSFEVINNALPNMPEMVRNAVMKAGFAPPQTPFELYEVFANSLAKHTLEVLNNVERIMGKAFDNIYIVGGGSKAEAVNRRIAGKCNKNVYTGITEAAALGNLLSQMITLDIIKDQHEAADIVRNSFEMRIV